MPQGYAYLEGGPCKGETVKLTPAEADEGQLVCKGGLYQNPYTGAHHHGSIIFVYKGPAPGTGGGGVTGSVATHAHKGWSDLQHAVNRDLPTTLARIGRL